MGCRARALVAWRSMIPSGKLHSAKRRPTCNLDTWGTPKLSSPLTSGPPAQKRHPATRQDIKWIVSERQWYNKTVSSRQPPSIGEDASANSGSVRSVLSTFAVPPHEEQVFSPLTEAIVRMSNPFAEIGKTLRSNI